jgi:DNA-binding NtrC family response regulator
VRVLVVDDSAEVRSRLLELLKSLYGIDAAEAGGADEALELLARSPADVVVLDLHLGERNGLDLITQVSARLPRTFVVVLTNDPSQALWRESLKRGASFFFDKSRDYERAVDVVAHCLVMANEGRTRDPE